MGAYTGVKACPHSPSECGYIYAHQSCPIKPDKRGLTQSTYGGGLTRIERTYVVRRAARQGNARGIRMQLLGLSALLLGDTKAAPPLMKGAHAVPIV